MGDATSPHRESPTEPGTLGRTTDGKSFAYDEGR